MITIIVPCYNERYLIERKIDNLICQYPVDKMEILIIDGGSTDGSFDLAKERSSWLNFKNNQKVISVYKSEKGKTKQLNYGLSMARGEIVFVTDVDAVMEKDCIHQMMRFFPDKIIGVVGACSVPYKAKFLDPICWRISNFIRLAQSDLCTSPWVIATCYAFRKELVSKFPDDVVADDAYIALCANFKGYHSVYTDRTVVKEVRNPSSWIQFFTHKHRKANALLREFTRFSYMLPYADPVWKTLFLMWFAFLIIVVGWSYPFYKQDSNFRRVK